MMTAAVIALMFFGIVVFSLGNAIGRSQGKRLARTDAFNQCIDWAALAMKGNPHWRRLSAADALLKAGALIGGDDVMPPSSYQPPRIVSTAPFHYESAALSKGIQA
jgi:hypothetical protein